MGLICYLFVVLINVAAKQPAGGKFSNKMQLQKTRLIYALIDM